MIPIRTLIYVVDDGAGDGAVDGRVGAEVSCPIGKVTMGNKTTSIGIDDPLG